MGSSVPNFNEITNPITSMFGGGSSGTPQGPGTNLDQIKNQVAQIMPAYSNPLGANGKLQSQFVDPNAVKANATQITAPANLTSASYNPATLDTSTLGEDQGALDALKARAEGTGPSPWLQMQQQQNNLATTQQLGGAAAGAMGSNAAANDSLAMHGGLESGASERNAQASMRSLDATRQGINAQGQVNNLNLGIADDQTKMGLLSQIPGMDLANANYKSGLAEYNTGAINQGSQFNVNNTNATNQFNNSMQYNTSAANAGNALNASEYNAGAQNNVNAFNVNSALTANQGLNSYNAQKGALTGALYGAGQTANAAAANAPQQSILSKLGLGGII